MYAIRLPGGQWWRRGHGKPGQLVKRITRATLYPSSVGAMRAATWADMLDRFGSFEVVTVGVVDTGESRVVSCQSGQ